MSLRKEIARNYPEIILIMLISFFILNVFKEGNYPEIILIMLISFFILNAFKERNCQKLSRNYSHYFNFFLCPKYL